MCDFCLNSKCAVRCCAQGVATCTLAGVTERVDEEDTLHPNTHPHALALAGEVRAVTTYVRAWAFQGVLLGRISMPFVTVSYLKRVMHMPWI